MTLSISDPPSAWHRTLPKPTALLSEAIAGPCSRRGSSIPQQHMIHEQPYPSRPSEQLNRRNTIPYLPAQLHSEYTSKGFEHTANHARPLSPIVVDANEDLIRKRNASFMAEDNLSGSSSPTSSTAVEGAGQFCLCQPDPKIPRPRNAFILYRQHHQAAVVAQHPGLPNPDISKIIGEQWRRLPYDAKNEWKALAEEEKTRHQQQYPDYRYQPRRNGRYSSQSSISGPSSGGTIGPNGNCLKCGGKIMNPPNTPYPAFAPVTPGIVQPMVSYSNYQRTHPLTAPQANRPVQYHMMSPPHSARQRPHAEFSQPPTSRTDPRLRYHGTQPPPSTPMHDSHDSKRRRFNGNGVYIPSPQMYGEPMYQFSPQGSTTTRPEMPQPMQGLRSAIAVPNRVMYTQSQPQMQPPQLHPIHAPHAQHKRDSSLTLPPLKTTIMQPSQNSVTQTQKSGMEAMIMSIPVLNKIKILSQISPSLAAPGIGSPQHEVRGAIIAVEGMDPTSIYNMTNSLAQQLEKDGKFAVRIFGGPDPYLLAESGRRSSGAATRLLTLDGCLDILIEWHKISREMTEYITTKPRIESESDVMMLDGPGQVANHEQAANTSKNSQSTGNANTNVEEIPRSRRIPERMVRIDENTSTISPSTASPRNNIDSAVSPKTITKAANLSLITPPATTTIFSNNALSEANAATTTRIPQAAFLQQQQQQHVANLLNSPPPPPPPVSTRPKTPSPPPPLSHSTATATATSTTALPTTSHPPKSTVTISNAIPIAIVPHYQLTTVDTSSIGMPITDAYSPLAHWQWLATLWRGCVGPDVTVVIKGTNNDDETPTISSNAQNTEHDRGGSNTENGNGNTNHNAAGKVSNASGKPGGNNNVPLPAVEVRLQDYRTVVVRTGAKEDLSGAIDGAMIGKSTSSLEGDGSWESAKRRVGFEVAEFLRR